MPDSYDAGIYRHTKGAHMLVIPAPLARALTARGYTRATITVTPEGLLVRPYVGLASDKRTTALLPEWET